jgi:hypothetical protein
MTRIFAISLVLSAYVSTIILNYASREITLGNFIATVFFTLAFIAFDSFSVVKNHPPLAIGAKGWLIVSFLFCFISLLASSANFEITGYIAGFLGYGVMLFVSPFFGYAYIFKSLGSVSVLGMISCAVLFVLPQAVKRIAEKIRLSREFR